MLNFGGERLCDRAFYLLLLNLVFMEHLRGDTSICSSSYYSILNIKQKIVRFEHHEQVYREYLGSGIVPKGLRLKKRPCLGKTSEVFDKE